ncbi:SIR2 family NAD-dependent protein deacylase [Candidatus Uabimicrobium amorphum]|uniref:protein acetyllysine N-acetyltransferase n=1 Tax=Uabimicrobium amorphum TaxID=2596890 RepID=A0A5S9F2Q8_UABAM|nr:Sir2 family NAD-dependent protein deacetylase [Candidatus Uabimicrobium amorphum]BBM83491.1 NAD-dependent protein deacylase 2 [Candidatus Uabimicrobium amorphum]
MNDIETIVKTLQKSKRILFVTGAGMSADSGIPTYRGVGGLYNNDKLLEGKTIEEIMSGEMIRSNPRLVWECLQKNSAFFGEALPNRGHEIIAEMEKYFTVCVCTQNVDGFHSIAGSTNVIELHGTMRVLRCMNCDYRSNVIDIANLSIPPKCEKCKKIMRPDVVFFNEMLCYKKMSAFGEEMACGFDMVFVIGTSSRFVYIVSPIYKLYEQQAFITEINPEVTDVSDLANVHLKSGASKSLQDIWEAYLHKIV